MAELTTAVKHGMNITHVLLNNGQLGKISQELRRRVIEPAELDAAPAAAVAHDGSAMVEVPIDPAYCERSVREARVGRPGRLRDRRARAAVDGHVRRPREQVEQAALVVAERG